MLGGRRPPAPPQGSRLSEGKCSESTSCLRDGARSGYSRDMQYAILRVQKLKSSAAVHRSMKHAFRAQDTPNADPALTPDNTHIGAQNVAEGMAAFRARLPEKFRKDAVQCVEYLMTASPEVMQAKSRDEQDAYFRLPRMAQETPRVGKRDLCRHPPGRKPPTCTPTWCRETLNQAD